jgi:putative ABC transport system permease protein
MEEAILEIPGVAGVAMSSEIPMVAANNFVQGLVVDDPVAPPGPRVTVERWIVTPDYFSTLGIELLRGRYLTERDDEGSRRVLVVSAEAAERLWPGQDPIGRTLRAGPGTEYERVYTVAGVVQDIVKDRGRDAQGYPTVYWSLLSEPLAPSRYLIVRTLSDPGPLIQTLRETVWSVFPEQTIPTVERFDDLLYRQYAAPRFRTLLLVAFGVVALLIAAIGVYGVVSYSVTRKTREMGIRMALGSRPVDILRLVMGEGVTLVLSGIVLGVIGALIGTRLIEAFLFGTEAIDGPTYLAISGIFVVVGALAAWVPARRAMRIDPTTALRSE